MTTMGDLISGDAATVAETSARLANLRAIVTKWASPPSNMVSKLPKGGDKDRKNWATCRACKGWHATNAVHLDYMGHADVTMALLDVDPEWTWEPFAIDTDGQPAYFVVNEMATMWIKLTILGVTRMAVGTCAIGKEEMVKELYGDAIRNGAMRFGIGTLLWSKNDANPVEGPAAAPPGQTSRPGPSRAAAPGGRTPVEQPADAASPPGAASAGEDNREAAKQRGRERAEAAVAGAPDPHPPLDPEQAKADVTLPAEVMRRMEALIAATPQLNPNQRQVQVVQLVRASGGQPGTITAMMASDQTWLMVCDKYGIEPGIKLPQLSPLRR